MALIDLISAKLEAFETRIEDRLRALFTEFRLGRSPTPRRSQRGESSNRKENPPERGTSDGLIVSTHKEPEDVDPEPEKEDAETADHQHHTCPSRPRQPAIHEGRRKLQPITILIGTGSTNNFIDNKVAARLTLWIEDCSRFDIKVADGRILNCNRKCPQVKLVLQSPEITVDFFLLPLDDYQVVLDIE
ncbi:hypothetical protein B296_00009755 [Ensete ventricosum]|uniref:Uncharacterized protein n=1 Tax=Ensete ventricosum TaxID=4639 RepID=A0A426ZZ40_ENSVE|nr:hypothetical protein B296_00009755 [Ensete ventricosum]